MGIITNRGCFTGVYKVSQTCFDELDKYIDAYEETFLQDLLGCALFDLFQADLVNGVPQTQRFIDLFDKFCLDPDNVISFSHTDCNKQYKSLGMKDMVTALIYFQYTRDNYIKNTDVGLMINEGETSALAGSGIFYDDIYERWNRGIESYNSIQYKIYKESDTYPEYRGVSKEAMYFGGAI